MLARIKKVAATPWTRGIDDCSRSDAAGVYTLPAMRLDPTTLALAAIAFLLGSPTTLAQVPTRALDESAVVSAILNADPRLADAQAQAQLAAAQVELATPRWSPSAYYTLEHFGERASLDQEHELGAGATLVAPHQRAAQDQARVQQARAQFQASRIAHQRVLSGLRRFYRILALQEELQILKLWKQGLQELVRIAQARVQAGEAPEYEKLRIELALRSAYSEIRVAQAQAQTEGRTFASFLGLPEQGTQFQGSLLPKRAPLQRSLAKVQERPSLQSLSRAQKSIKTRRRTWIPSLSLNAGLRVRRHAHIEHWGFGLGIRGAFAHPKRAAAVRQAATASQRAVQSQIDSARYRTRHAARRSGLLCLTLLDERQRYIQEIQEVLEPLERALKAEYREGQRDIIGLMSVLERSMQSRRYRLELAKKARAAELDFREAKGVFER